MKSFSPSSSRGFFFFILLQKSMKQSEYEFSTFGEVSAQVEEIKLLYLISSCFGSFLLPQAGTTLFCWFYWQKLIEQ